MSPTVSSVLLPAALAVIMFGLGLSLTADDFRRVAVHPRAVLVALVCQALLLPAVCFGLVLAFGLPPSLAVGMMLLAASPGGPTANLYSHLFGGDVALNVTLTAINSLTAVFTLPLVANLSLAYFYADAGTLGLQFDKTVQVFAVVLVPAALGMLIRAARTAFADRMARPVKVLSVVTLAAVIAVAVVSAADGLAADIRAVGLVCLLFSVVSLTAGYWLPRLAGVAPRQAVASCMEIGIHNSTLAIAVAVSPALLGDPRMAIPAVVYGVLVFLVAAAAGFAVRRGARPALALVPASGAAGRVPL
ncbi:bile acid:sodium symporter family protein [Planomonospora parontospora]|uniref:bile acid:sodium symporter family protein n=1 Tax=Planomonospora parontospora TaxID=58119 RepID=UPI0016703CA3|nr:bile acid:sodium symporter family protein [Planomonospora parontospora]GGL14315.1 transporter [Planomonospora parontospora subsp. antibiotica]GII17844.1 transporter [Planomonospora parontospora subsp. antibiotica]